MKRIKISVEGSALLDILTTHISLDFVVDSKQVNIMALAFDKTKTLITALPTGSTPKKVLISITNEEE